jgi:ligand-binding sensor protein
MTHSAKKDWHYIKKCLAVLTRYYLGDIFADNPVHELNEREICRILKGNAETASQCRKTCGFDCPSAGRDLTTCHAGLSLFTLVVPVNGSGETVHIVGGKVLTRMVDREECIRLAERARVEPHRIIEALGDVRIDSTENLLAARSLLKVALSTLLLKDKQARKAASENVALV